jgi:hypothetical protein
MTTATYASRVHTPSLAHTAARSIRGWSISTRAALLACGALTLAYGLRTVADAGPSHLHAFVFFAGAAVLVVAIAWSFPFLGALLLASASVATWLFVDATPVNALLATPLFVVACMLLHRWHVERDAA